MKRLKPEILKRREQDRTIRSISHEFNICENTMGYYIRLWKTGIPPHKKYNEKRKEQRKRERGVWNGTRRAREISNERKRYKFNCTNPSKTQALKLPCILENSRKIHYATFAKNVEKEFIEEFNRQVAPPTLKEEPYANFYKSVTPEGKQVYYFQHSGIEYIFY